MAGKIGGPLRLDFTEPRWIDRARLFVLGNRRINFANFTDVCARLYGKRTAFALDRPIDYPGFSGDVLSYRDVQRLVSRMAHALRAIGVGRGDRVAMITVNRIEMAFCSFAAAKLGAIPVPMNFMLRASEIDDIVRRSGAEVLVCDELIWRNTIADAANVPSVKQWVLLGDDEAPAGTASMRSLMAGGADDFPAVEPASESDTALLFFTSGTTGFPKGAMLSHASAMVGVRHHGRIYSLKPRIGDELALLVMPVAHSGGYTGMLLQFSIGRASYFVSRFNPADILDTIERYRATMFVGSPTMFRMLLDAGASTRDITSVRIWGGGSDSFDDALVEKFRTLGKRRRFGIAWKPMFVRGYGMAEANSYVSTTLWFPHGDNCLGWVMPPVRFRIVDSDGHDVPAGQVGELHLRGPSIMTGYWNDPEATAEAFDDGWMRTGDLVRQGKWKMLYFEGRTGEVIKCGGYKISAGEIDRVVGSHPDVERAATVGMPDTTKGELPVTAVVLRRGCSSSAEDVLTFARERLAAYKAPREIRVVDEMPLTISLKVKRREVLARLQAEDSARRG